MHISVCLLFPTASLRSQGSCLMSFFRITPSRHSVSILGLNALFTIFSLVIFSFCVNYKLARLHLISDTMLSFTDLMYCNIYLLALLFKKKNKNSSLYSRSTQSWVHNIQHCHGGHHSIEWHGSVTALHLLIMKRIKPVITCSYLLPRTVRMIEMRKHMEVLMICMVVL